MDGAVENDPGAKSEGIRDAEKRRLEDFALKRKFASLSSKLDRVHRQVCYL